MRFHENGREYELLGLLNGDDLVLCGELEEDLRWDILLKCVGEEV